jgi:hypothetical protein
MRPERGALRIFPHDDQIYSCGCAKHLVRFMKIGENYEIIKLREVVSCLKP